MVRRLVVLGFVLICLSPGAADSTPAVAFPGVFFGGGVSASFGDVDFVSVEPLVGVRVLPKVAVGVRGIYRYRKDSRFSPSLSTNDYGGSLFARYRLTGPLFLQGEYERLRYEFPIPGGGKDRDEFDSILGGAGISTPLIPGRASFFALALYNFSYDDDDLRSPYAEAWVIRAGVGFGF